VVLPLLVLAGASVAAANFREKIEELSAELVKGLSGTRSLRIAVADLPDLRGTTNDFGRFVAERLATRLAQAGRFTVIERRRLSQVLGELKFSMSDLVDPAKARRLGQMLGVEALVVGSISDLGNQVDVDLRVIEIETNRMILGASATIAKDQVVADLLRGGTAAQTERPQATSESAGRSEPRRAVNRTMTLSSVATLEIVDIRRQGAGLQFVTTLTNTTKESRHYSFGMGSGGCGGYVVDADGNRYTTGSVGPGSFQSEPSVPQRIIVSVQGLPANSTRATFRVGDCSSGARATERDIALPQ
jgi:TolB-like protein